MPEAFGLDCDPFVDPMVEGRDEGVIDTEGTMGATVLVGEIEPVDPDLNSDNLGHWNDDNVCFTLSEASPTGSTAKDNDECELLDGRP